MPVDNHLTKKMYRSDPTPDFRSIIPSDSDDLQFLPVAIYVGSAGTVALVRRDNTVVNVHLIEGYHPIRPKRINATGTTATHLMGLY